MNGIEKKTDLYGDLGMSPPREKRIVRLVWLVGASLTLISLLLLGLNLSALLSREVDLGIYIGFLWAISYLSVGAIILNAKPRHRVGLILLGMGSIMALYAFAQQYAVYGLVTVAPPVLPGARLAGWFQHWGLYIVFPAGVALPYLIFPDGNLPSRRWRPVLWLVVLLSVMLVLAPFFAPGPVGMDAFQPPVNLRMENPTGSESIINVIYRFGYAWLAGVLIVPLAIIAPISRFRRARGLERQQLKWLAYSGILVLILTPLMLIGPRLFDDDGIFGTIYLALLILILPGAAGIAIVRSRLYDIDLLINRTLVYGVLTIILGLFYFASITLFQSLFSSLTGQRSSFAVVVSTLLIAVLFQPARRRVQAAIDRRFYRQKYNAERILATFSLSLREGVDQEALAGALIDTVDQALQPSNVSLWLRESGIAPGSNSTRRSIRRSSWLTSVKDSGG